MNYPPILPISTTLLLLSYFGIGVANLLEILTQAKCASSAVNVPFEIVCPIQSLYPSHGPNLCDSHCRCIHKAQYGYCEKRPNTGPSGTIGGMWCRCKYDNPPPNWNSNNPTIEITCKIWDLIRPLCPKGQFNATVGICTSDCVCSHGCSSGNCDYAGNCICKC